MTNNTSRSICGDKVVDQDIIIPLTISSAIAFLSNIFVCYLIITVQRLKTATNVFIFSLCVCNLMVAGALIPVYCYCQESLVYRYVVLITVVTYIGNLTAVTYERWYSITYPLHYDSVITETRAIKITIVAWIVPLSYCLLPLIWHSDDTAFIHKIYICGTLVVFLLLPLLFILYVYIKVCMEIKKMYELNKKITLQKQKISDALSSAAHGRFSKCWDLLLCKRCKSNEAQNDTTGSNKELENDISPNLLHPDSSIYSTTSTTSNKRNLRSLINLDDGITDDSIDSTPPTPITLSMDNISNGHTKDDTEPLHKKKNSIMSRMKRKEHIKRTSKAGRSKMKHRMRELKASFAFAVVAFTYMFTWLPVVVLNFMGILEISSSWGETLGKFSVLAIAVNSLTDPFLYGLLLKNFRVTLKQFVRRLGGNRFK